MPPSLREIVKSEMDARGWSELDVEKHGGPSYKTMKNITNGSIPDRGDVYERLEIAFDWAKGSGKGAGRGVVPVKKTHAKAHHPALATLATLRSVIPEAARTEAVTTLLDLLHEQISAPPE